MFQFENRISKNERLNVFYHVTMMDEMQTENFTAAFKVTLDCVDVSEKGEACLFSTKSDHTMHLQTTNTHVELGLSPQLIYVFFIRNGRNTPAHCVYVSAK